MPEPGVGALHLKQLCVGALLDDPAVVEDDELVHPRHSAQPMSHHERGPAIHEPTSLPRLPTEQALATVALPLHLNWSAPGRQFSMRDRSQRARVYEIVLGEGGPEDVLTYIDGVLLVDLWDELVLPRNIRAAWAPVVESAVQVAA